MAEPRNNFLRISTLSSGHGQIHGKARNPAAQQQLYGAADYFHVLMHSWIGRIKEDFGCSRGDARFAGRAASILPPHMRLRNYDIQVGKATAEFLSYPILLNDDEIIAPDVDPVEVNIKKIEQCEFKIDKHLFEFQRVKRGRIVAVDGP